jgi:hypothetical protein
MKKEREEIYTQHRHTLKSYVKARLHIPFPHAFSALRCEFLLLTLVLLNQGK